ncbi:MAG: hypothetical protein K8R13_03505 [Methanococcoides sp.]|nr:hypothetical protein [Methanococcoides sp.]
MGSGRGPIKAISILCVLAFTISVGCISISEPPAINLSAYMEGEARVYDGVNLTPISQQGNFMIEGIQ